MILEKSSRVGASPRTNEGETTKHYMLCRGPKITARARPTSRHIPAFLWVNILNEFNYLKNIPHKSPRTPSSHTKSRRFALNRYILCSNRLSTICPLDVHLTLSTRISLSPCPLVPLSPCPLALVSPCPRGTAAQVRHGTVVGRSASRQVCSGKHAPAGRVRSALSRTPIENHDREVRSRTEIENHDRKPRLKATLENRRPARPETKERE
jgi:hypothetical protein